MTYTAEMINAVRDWFERERGNWPGWKLHLHKEAGECDDFDDGERTITHWLDEIATLERVNDAGWDISDEYDTVTIQNSAQVSVTSSYDERMPLLDAAQLRGLAELCDILQAELDKAERS